MRSIEEIKNSTKDIEESLTILKNELSMHTNTSSFKKTYLVDDLIGKSVKVYDRYLFAVPVTGVIIGVSEKDGAYSINFHSNNPGGKNAMRELVTAIYNVNEEYNTHSGYCMFVIDRGGNVATVECSERNALAVIWNGKNNVLEKLGKDKIKLALEQRM